MKKINNKLNYEFDEIEICEQVGSFKDEYVYDIEMEDNHTFFANDLLVHNSVYVSFWEAMQSCNWKGSANDFVLQLTNIRLQDYINKCFDIYAEKAGCDYNLQQLELEKIADSSIILSKKKYTLDITWKEPDNYYDSLSNITSSGIEIVQSSTPAFAREQLNVMLKEIFKHKENLKMADFLKLLNKLKADFKLSDIENIAMSSSVGDYEKFILNDRNKLEIASGCPIHVRGAGIYNYLLNKSKYKSKYNLITSGEKIKYYYAKPKDGNQMFNIFGYIAGNHPYEFAPEVDFDIQFQKTIVDPLSRFTNAMGYGNIPETLITTKNLF